MNIITTENLKSFYVLNIYDTQKIVKAVNGINLEIKENEIYGIAGESGCGKSTLLKVLIGAVEPPLKLIQGKVYYYKNNQKIDVYSLNDEEMRELRWKYISYIPQGSMSVLNPVARIRKTFKDFLETHLNEGNREKSFEMVEEHIKKLGLPLEILNAYPHQLSGGMRQRVTIALATFLGPKVIIADEPTTALDVVTQRGIIQLLKDVQREFRNTLIIVTHDMGVHANIADRIGIMYAGKLIEEADTREIFKNPYHPYTKYLIHSLPKFGDKMRKKSAPGRPPSLTNLPHGCAFHPRCPYALDKCKTEEPHMKELKNNHKVSCWLVEGEK